MANIYKANDKRRKVVPGGTVKPQDGQEAPEGVTTPAKPEPAQEAPSVPVSEPIAEPAAEVEAQAPARNLLEDLIPQKKKPRPETYGFYLDSDVHDELVKLAKQNKTNKSRFLNALLRRVLFDE